MVLSKTPPLMNLRGKIITSFVIVSLVVGFTVFLFQEQVSEIEVKKHAIENIELLHEGQESDFLSYLRGDKEFEQDITDTHNKIQQGIRSLITKSSYKDQIILQNLQDIDSIIYQKMLDPNDKDSTANFINTRDDHLFLERD